MQSGLNILKNIVWPPDIVWHQGLKHLPTLWFGSASKPKHSPCFIILCAHGRQNKRRKKCSLSLILGKQVLGNTIREWVWKVFREGFRKGFREGFRGSVWEKREKVEKVISCADYGENTISNYDMDSRLPDVVWVFIRRFMGSNQVIRCLKSI